MLVAGSLLVGLASANPDVEATGSSYGAASAAAHSARLHSAFTGAASLSGSQEAAKTELALKAWLKHQSAAQLAYIEKTPAAADDIDMKTWAKYYNEAVDRTSVRRWHKELASTTHNATHTAHGLVDDRHDVRRETQISASKIDKPPRHTFKQMQTSHTPPRQQRGVANHSKAPPK